MRNYFNKFIVSCCFLSFISIANARNNAWFDALKQTDEWTLSGLIFKGADVNAVDARGNTAMHLTAKEGQLRMVLWLLKQKGIDVNRRNAAGETALMLSLIQGHEAISDALIERGANINQVGWTPLHYAAASKAPTSSRRVQQLIEDHAAYIDAESPNGTTPLMMAARYGLAETVKSLIDIGADVEVKNQLGLDALAFAKQGESPDAVRWLTTKLDALALARAEAKAKAEAEAAAKEKARVQTLETIVIATPINGAVRGPEALTLSAIPTPAIPTATEPAPIEPSSADLARPGEAVTAAPDQRTDNQVPEQGDSRPSALPPATAFSADTPTAPEVASAATKAITGQSESEAVPIAPPIQIVVPDDAFGRVVTPKIAPMKAAPAEGAKPPPTAEGAPQNSDPGPREALLPATRAPLASSILARQPYVPPPVANIGAIFKVEGAPAIDADEPQAPRRERSPSIAIETAQEPGQPADGTLSATPSASTGIADTPVANPVDEAQNQTTQDGSFNGSSGALATSRAPTKSETNPPAVSENGKSASNQVAAQPPTEPKTPAGPAAASRPLDTDANSPRPDLPNADVTNAKVPAANVPTADAANANVPAANVPTADVTNANVPAANVPTADAANANVPTANLPTADVTNASVLTAPRTPDSAQQIRTLDVAPSTPSRPTPANSAPSESAQASVGDGKPTILIQLPKPGVPNAVSEPTVRNEPGQAHALEGATPTTPAPGAPQSMKGNW